MTPAVRWIAVSAVLLGLTSPSSASAQTVTEWSAEQRVSLSFRVNETALQKLLPEGWTIAPSTAPGNPGGNLNVTFIERNVVLDGQGKQYRAGSSRYIVFVVPARNSAGVANSVIVSGLSPEGAGAYGVNLTATVSQVQRSETAQAEETGRAEERWEFAAASGEQVSLQIAYRRAPATKSHAETKIRSAKRPDFTRSYRVDQAADVVRSATTPDRVESLTFRATGPAFAALFDGRETLLSVTSFPWYVREISVP